MMIIYMLGTISLIGGLCVLLNCKKKKQKCITCVEGVVTSVGSDVSPRYDDFFNYHPEIDFYIGNERISVKLRTPVSYYTYKVGQKVLVHYNPNNPKEFYINKNISQIVYGIIFTVAGIVLLICPLLLTMIVNKN